LKAEQTTNLLKDQISVNHSATRSVNIEYDIRDDNMLENYLMTSQVRLSISRILSGLNENGTKAWILTGPYGSGKSFFSLFLARLLTPLQGNHSKALTILKETDPILLEQLEEILNESLGYFLVTISGYRASLEECIFSGITRSIQNSGDESLINWLNVFNQTEISTNGNSETKKKRLVDLIDELTGLLTSNGKKYKGILFIFDEMGKALEQASFHNQENDIYLLQEISEHTNRKQNIFIGVLHQSFERYASLLDNSTQREWAKVQGRFEDIPFQEPPIQQLRLLQRALTRQDLGKFEQTILENAKKAAEDGWKPALMDNDEFSEIARKVYPLHPSSFAVLPHFFRRLAQNERSIFAFLTSLEPFGFQEFISQKSIRTYFRLPDLFDYLLANYQGRIYSSGRGRILSEASDRLETINTLSELDIKIIKTIGLLNWMSEITNINATQDLILSALVEPTIPEDRILNALADLKDQSVIVFRRFNHSYIIWQGSDVDLEERISEGYNTLTGNISLAQSLEKYLPPRPLAARKHSYQTGTLRYFEIRYIDSMNLHQANTQPNPIASGICFICLPAKLSEVDDFIHWAESPMLASRKDIIIGITNKAIRMADLIQELAVLNWVKEETSELRDDPVARKELRARISNVENLISFELEESLSIQRISTSNTNQFFHLGQEIDTRSKSLMQILTDVLDQNYHSSPIILNEIINRNKLSTQAAMARKVIIHSILENSHLDHFGYEGYPPERSIYENLIAKSKMHFKQNGSWIIQAPIDNEMNLLTVWNYLEEQIFGKSIEPVSVQGLFNNLHSEPFGLTYGVAPILLCVFMKVYIGETTLYKQDMLIPEPSLAHWDLLVSRPDLFSVSGFRIEEARKKLIERFARGFNVEPALMAIVRTLVKGVNSLPEHTLVTKQLNSTTQTVREVILQATSPEKLLFEEIPKALGVEIIDSKTSDQLIDLFFERLNQTNNELISEMNRLLFWARNEFLLAFGLETGEIGWGNFRLIASQLVSKTNQPVMKPLYIRATDTKDSFAALEKVLAYIANRPPRNWTDMDSERFLSHLIELGDLFKQDQQQFAFDSLLTPEQQNESEQLAELIINNYLDKKYDDVNIIKGAINILNKKFFNSTKGNESLE
jgi:hypothetical protein